VPLRWHAIQHYCLAMYWPIGAPRVYAASSSKAHRDHAVESDDDAESRETTEGSGSLLNTPSIETDGKFDLEHERNIGNGDPGTPLTPGINPVEQDTSRGHSVRTFGQETQLREFGSGPADKEPLLALRISRTGHLFAVITATSLTIWQTKVRSFGV
jgi:hypothetical protein